MVHLHVTLMETVANAARVTNQVHQENVILAQVAIMFLMASMELTQPVKVNIHL